MMGKMSDSIPIGLQLRVTSPISNFSKINTSSIKEVSPFISVSIATKSSVNCSSKPGVLASICIFSNSQTALIMASGVLNS